MFNQMIIEQGNPITQSGENTKYYFNSNFFSLYESRNNKFRFQMCKNKVHIWILQFNPFIKGEKIYLKSELFTDL